MEFRYCIRSGLFVVIHWNAEDGGFMMLIETLGEGAKKIDSLLPDFLTEQAPEIPWKNLKGLRDHIAHGYFNLDADIIFDVAINEVPTLKKSLDKLISYLE